MTSPQPVIVPRWEWRTFGASFGVAEERFAALTSTGIQESDELYLVSDTNANVKVRAALMDVKVLVETNEDGLQQWRPIMKAEFPVTAEIVDSIFDALGQAHTPLERDTYTLDQFVAELAPRAGLRPVDVHKRRVRYVVGGCTSEVTDVVADGQRIRTIAIESEDAAAVVSAVKAMGLWSYVNTDYGKGIAAILDAHKPRFAVIDVGTNSIKFHVGERLDDGSWRRIVDRAEMSRLGEGLDEHGSIQPEPLKRTTAAVADMAAEARAQGARAIVAVGTAVFRIASNGSDAVAAIRDASGVEVEVVSGEEESRLAYLAARSAAAGAGDVVVFDTGGGSSQFTFGAGGSILDRFSVNVGAVSYTERFGLDKAVEQSTLDEAKAAIKADLADLATHNKPDAVVGMGGAVTNMTAVSKQMTAYDPDAIQGSVLEAAEIERQIEMYKSMSADERRSIAGLQPKRAEVILAGACIVSTILDELGAQSFTVSDRGLRHGVLLERFGSEETSR